MYNLGHYFDGFRNSRALNLDSIYVILRVYDNLSGI
jgi:hypothetical protein